MEKATQKVPLDAKQRNITWQTLAMMAFMTVWGFGNVINGYAFYGGMRSILTWVIVFVIYFVPYALMVGEMGSAFKEAGGGVSSWVEQSFSKKLAYYAGWTYWVVHMPYISQKPLNIVVAGSWAIWGDKRASDFNFQVIQLICIIIFLLVVVTALQGINIVKKITSIAGLAGLVMSLLFILMAISAPLFRDISFNRVSFNSTTLLPTFDWKYVTSFSVLLFAVGGCEKISPYVNKVKNPGKGFPRGIIFMTAMVITTAILGTIALAMMFDPLNPPKDLVTNGAYEAFQMLGNWYGVGNLFVILYAISIVVAQFAVMVLSIDAPLRILIESSDHEFIPKFMRKGNHKGAYVNGIKLISVIVLSLLIIPMFGIGQVNEMVKFLIKLNSVCMPLRYLWVFVAYIGLKKAAAHSAEYIFTKNKTMGIFLGGWCFALTAASCALGMYDEDPFKFCMKVITPFVLIGLGLILPQIAKKQNNRS
ncbi:APC family permease [Mageeibacillus indolicus]|uniref:Amino acid permease n=2 Tax=Mageeibacillus indolicus TaxID=884684 RepID=D3QZ33_MAGIU|nr:amino acid permease [Mageeibacillus indolicus]ADC90822.1 amino acid permease [Mageeibacillus indolicus UPII9-5]PNH17984.1 transporter [Mageeibacillus indolicus]